VQRHKAEISNVTRREAEHCECGTRRGASRIQQRHRASGKYSAGIAVTGGIVQKPSVARHKPALPHGSDVWELRDMQHP